MAAAKLSMRKILETLRLRWGKGRSERDVARSVGVSPSTVVRLTQRASRAGLSWPLPPDLDEGALEAMLYPPCPAGPKRPRAPLDNKEIHRELRRKHVTLRLLWEEYRVDHREDGYGYSRFCELYRRWAKKLDVVMRQEHRAGEKGFVDFSGDGIPIVNRRTGEVTEAAFFVAALGASSFTYAEAYPSEELRWWIEGHIRAFEYFGGVPEITVPDQPRTSTSRPCHYDPDINPTYLEWARHTGTIIIPARPRKPRDKPKVESAVLVAQRWILAALRNHTFFSIDQANEAIREKLEELNDRKFQRLDVSRRDLYLNLDKPALQPLPSRRYEFAEWSRPRVNIDYHVDVERHFYSVPFQLVHEVMDVRRTARTVEIFHKGRRIVSHVRSYQKGGYTTLKEHMPPDHQRYLEWSPSRILAWAGRTGPKTRDLAETILQSRPHPALGYRACLGLLRLGKHHGSDRLEAACTRALQIGACSYKSVKSILQNGLDRETLTPTARRSPVLHENIRGPGYYDGKEEAC
jgi:transposase